MDDNLMSIIISLGICVGLPVLIVWLVTRARNIEMSKRCEVVIEAIRANKDVDVDELLTSMHAASRTPQQLLQLRLLRGCIFAFIGIACAVMALIFGLTDGIEGAIAPIIIGSLSLAIGVAYLVVYYTSRSKPNSNATDPQEL